MSPASTRPLPFTSTGVPARLSRLSASVRSVGVVVLDAFEVTLVPSGSTASAVAVLSILPASTSAWLIVPVPVQTTRAPGARVPAGQSTSARASVTPGRLRLTAPVLVSANVQLTVSPASRR